MGMCENVQYTRKTIKHKIYLDFICDELFTPV